ncbi:MAG: O-methyltransferase [Acidobacteriota bacterium]|nr:O-methyltransferase [Blastocatellia bacterium]MDW8240455.1 O-methyltransferase [Acidobacteriota bacterium]
MSYIVESQVERYMEQLIPERDPVLQEMEQLAAEKGIPIVGPVVGRFLFQQALLLQARRIFELGSAIGYSTIWLAWAVSDAGVVYYTDSSPEYAEMAREFCRRAGVEQRVRFLVGEALESLDSVDGQFDIVFNDVNKYQYPQVFLKAASRVRQGGLLIADNVLWGGRVARGDQDSWTEGIRQYNRLIYEAPDFLTTIVPLRDGVSLSLKLYS